MNSVNICQQLIILFCSRIRVDTDLNETTGMSRFSLSPMRQDGVKASDKKWERENQYQYWVKT